MAELNRRLQLLLSDEQFDFLKNLSDQSGQSVSELIRRAVEETFRPASNVRALGGLRKLRATDYLPEIPVTRLLEQLEEYRAP
jgi:predicted DNA-binding protein